MATKRSAGVRAKLRRLLRDAFSGAEVKLDPSANGKVGGLLIWDGFLGQDQVDRQRAVRDAVRRGLDTEEQRQISAILTVTPDEIAVMNRG